jgi:hypothetical protein
LWAGNSKFAEGNGNYRLTQPLNDRTLYKTVDEYVWDEDTDILSAFEDECFDECETEDCDIG